MTTPSEKYMRIQIDKRRDEITQTGCEYDGPVGDAMERAVEIYGDIRSGIPHHGNGGYVWTAEDIIESVSEHDDADELFRSAIAGLFCHPSALAVAINMAPSRSAVHLQQLSDAIQMAAGVMCGDLACESIISDQDEAGRP